MSLNAVEWCYAVAPFGGSDEPVNRFAIPVNRCQEAVDRVAQVARPALFEILRGMTRPFSAAALRT
jgi:hypothetical protein